MPGRASPAHRSIPFAERLELHALARAQAWVVSREQLTEDGMSRSAVAHAKAAKRLFHFDSGVFVVGRRAIGPRGLAWAAFLATGPSAAISHEWAAWLHGFGPIPATPCAVTTTSGRTPSMPAVHRVRTLPPTTDIAGLPVTTPHATLIALAATVSQVALRRFLVEAEVQRLIDHERLAHEARGARGCRQLLELLAPGLDRTASPLEDEVRNLLRRAGITPPEVGARVEGWSVDFLWRAERVVLEADSVTYHGTASNFDRDLRKQHELEVAGYRVIRVTRQLIRTEPLQVVALVVRAISASR